jgi:hypothetical protein
MTKQEIKDKALKHIERCDEIFDGKMWIADKEFAYLEMRVLALELLEEVMKPISIPTEEDDEDLKLNY